jgi:hypothetical protein
VKKNFGISAFDLQSVMSTENNLRKSSVNQSMRDIAAELTQKIHADFND